MFGTESYDYARSIVADVFNVDTDKQLYFRVNGIDIEVEDQGSWRCSKAVGICLKFFDRNYKITRRSFKFKFNTESDIAKLRQKFTEILELQAEDDRLNKARQARWDQKRNSIVEWTAKFKKISNKYVKVGEDSSTITINNKDMVEVLEFLKSKGAI